MDLPYYVFGIVYLAILFIYVIILFFNLYHMMRYGFFDRVGKFNTILVTGAISVIIIITVILLWPVDWLETITIL